MHVISRGIAEQASCSALNSTQLFPEEGCFSHSMAQISSLSKYKLLVKNVAEAALSAIQKGDGPPEPHSSSNLKPEEAYTPWPKESANSAGPLHTWAKGVTRCSCCRVPGRSHGARVAWAARRNPRPVTSLGQNPEARMARSLPDRARPLLPGSPMRPCVLCAL